MALDPGRPYRLSRQVSLRPEEFGALAYHFGNRRLTFLKTARMAEVVRTLEEHDSVRAALRAAGVPADSWSRYEHALSGLAESGIIEEAEPQHADRAE